MNKLDLKKMEAALETRAHELARSAAGRNQITIERTADAFDDALQSADREYSARTMTQDFLLLREVQAARKRLRAGEFGICQRCEEEISPKRLQAIPWASHCVSCQAELEGAEMTQARFDRAA